MAVTSVKNNKHWMAGAAARMSNVSPEELIAEHIGKLGDTIKERDKLAGWKAMDEFMVLDNLRRLARGDT